jgi:hypothetical protein
MKGNLQELVAAIERWRSHNIQDYWLHIAYIGAELNRFGDHDLTFTQGRLWHLWEGEWREIKPGSDYWLFSVPGAFAWARDMLTKVLPASGMDEDAIELRFDPEYGYVEFMRVKVAKRDEHNFTFEVRAFGEGPHPDFEA